MLLRSRASRLMVAVAIVGMIPLACDSAPPARDTLTPWPAGEPVVVGACSFVLEQANLWHSTEWHLEVRVDAQNTGSEAVYCGFSARAVTSANTALTREADGGAKLAAGELREHVASTREANETGISAGANEGAWVHVALSEGRWPLATTHDVSLSPDRVRPP